MNQHTTFASFEEIKEHRFCLKIVISTKKVSRFKNMDL